MIVYQNLGYYYWLIFFLVFIRDLDIGDIIKKIWGYDIVCER